MWADALLALERAHLVRLALWAGASALIGTVLLLVMTVRRIEGALLRHFAIQTAAWGVVTLLLCALSRRSLALRDYAGAQRLLNLLWLNCGLDVGYVAVGITLALACWRWGTRSGAGVGGIGAGVGIMLQGTALLLLDLRLLVAIGPMQ